MRQKIYSLFSITVLCTLVCAGCGAKKTETSKTPASDIASTEAVSQTEGGTEEMTTALNEETVSEPDTEGKTALTYIGHASVKIVTAKGTVIYIDPNYYEGDYSDKADYVFITHGHSDHQPCAQLQKKDDCVTITYKEAHHDDVYEDYTFDDFSVHTVAAGGNANHSTKDCVGYIFTVDGITMYHAGDTSMIDEMKDLTDLNIDYAMYPIDGVYNMDAVEATEVANLVGAKNNIPIHELDFSATDNKKSDQFTPEGRLFLEYGQTIVLEK